MRSTGSAPPGAVADVFEDNPEVIDREPAHLPVVNHLGRALDLGSRWGSEHAQRFATPMVS